MKHPCRFPGSEAGSALLASAILALVVAGFLASYLIMLENERTAVARSQTWNRAMAAAESGVEEALALINKNVSIVGAISNWSTTATSDGWDTSSSYLTNTWSYYDRSGSFTWQNPGTIYHIQRVLNTTNGYYDVYVNNPPGNGSPEILSVGRVNWNGSGNNFTAGNAVRAVYLQATNAAQLGDNGLIAYQLTFNGNNVTIDSFDSSSPLHSIWSSNLWFHGAHYGAWSNTLSYDSSSPPSRTANVHVAAETNFIDVGAADIYGYINTAPGGTYSIKNTGSVGDLDWVHNGTSGLQPGHFKDDMNQTFTSLSLPVLFTNSVQINNWLPVTTYKTVAQTNGSWFWVQTSAALKHYTNVIRIGSVYTNGLMIGAGQLYTNIDNSGWTLPDGNIYDFAIPNRPEATNNIYYTMDSIIAHSSSRKGNLYVDSQYAVLYLTNGMNSPLLTLNTNADLFIYSQGDIIFGTTVNNTALARALTISDIQGHPINLTASGNSISVAKLLVPSSKLKFNGSGSTIYDIIGEIIGNNVNFNGHFNLHYDESLNTVSPSQQWFAGNWKEVVEQ